MNATELRGFLTGLILGDGTIDKGVHARAFRIKSIREEYINQIYYTLTLNTNFKVSKRYHPEKGIHKEYWEIVVQAHPYFAKLYHEFYDDYRKRVITGKALSWLTPQGLANWYMSDGYIVRVGITKGIITDRRVELATDRYSKKDVEYVCKFLSKAFGITCYPKSRKNFYRIKFPLEEAQKLFLLIYPYIVPSMYYKIDLQYFNNERPNWMSDEYFNLMKELRNSANSPLDNGLRDSQTYVMNIG